MNTKDFTKIEEKLELAYKLISEANEICQDNSIQLIHFNSGKIDDLCRLISELDLYENAEPTWRSSMIC